MRAKRGVEIVTSEQIADFLRCEWIERIWTFQEFALANNPIVVRGSCHISWSRLVISLAFYLVSHGPRFSNDIVSQQWLNLLMDRICVQSALNDSRNISSPDKHYVALQSYCRFLVRLVSNITTVSLWVFWPLVVLTFVLPVIGAILTGLQHHVMVPIFALGFAAFFGSGVCIIWSAFAPNPQLERFVDNTATPYLLNTEPKAVPTFFHALRLRKATNPKDMSFGLHSVLEKLTGKHLPLVDYRISLGTVYEQLAHYLITEYDSLEVIVLAAQAHRQDTPSWVPDFSQKLDSVGSAGEPHPAPQWRVHENGLQCLVLQGALVDTISSVRQLVPTLSTYHESEWDEHTRNIQLLQYLSEQHSNALSYEVLENLFILSSEVPMNLRAYFYTIWRTRSMDPSALLSLFLSSKTFYCFRFGWVSYSWMFKIHLEVCKLIRSRFSLVQLEGRLCFLPTAVEEGDKIAIFQGVQEPLVVRPYGDSVRLVSRTTASAVDALESPQIKWTIYSMMSWLNLLGPAYITDKTKDLQFEQIVIV